MPKRLESSFDTEDGDLWVEHTCNEGPNKGKTYFSQPKSGKTSWERPGDGAQIRKEGGAGGGGDVELMPLGSPTSGSPKRASGGKEVST